jgi:ATP-binding cassette subfamily F protein uup
MIAVQDLHLAYGDRVLMDALTFSIQEGERIALVGDNGAGKSTLLKVLARILPPDHGALHLPHPNRVTYLPQLPELPLEASVRDVVRQGLAHHQTLLGQHAALCQRLEVADVAQGDQLALELADLTERIEALGGFDLEHRIDATMDRLGLSDPDAVIGHLSGGAQRRVDLARVLLTDADVLLMDEPTNHLDIATISFVSDWLKNGRASVVFISHDRQFVDDVATRLLELHRGRIFSHQPPHASYVEARLVREDIAARTTHRRQRLAARELAWLRTGPKARTTKQNARVDRAEALIEGVAEEVRAQRQRKLDLMQRSSSRLAKSILEFKGVAVARGENRLFSDFSLILREGERWGVVGPNGCGKTSLLEALLERLPLASGKIEKGKHTHIAIFDQHRSDLPPKATLREVLAPDDDYVSLGDERIHIATFLERFLFRGEDARRQVDTLSGGEKNRLALARLFIQRANCILLDEPTNDLDVETIGVLEEAINGHDGVAILVSHDRQFLDRVCTGILAFEEAKGGEVRIVPYQGDFTHYLRVRQKEGLGADPGPSAKKQAAPRTPSPSNKTANEGGSGRRRKRTFNEERELAGMEALIEEKESRRDALSQWLSDGDQVAADPREAAAKAEELAALEKDVEGLYARWQELESIGS